MSDCIFCKIIQKQIPSAFVYENEDLVALNDLYPKAKTHLLIIPKKHIPTIMDLKENEQDELLVGKMMLAARDIAKEKGLPGYRLSFNVGKAGGQEIFHIHLHLMSDHG
ncbi:MAG: histidine triad nucleotide-binding protein [Candidatus Peregrinibacteria bacterium]